MAEIRTVGLLQRVDINMKRALEEALGRVAPDVDLDKGVLYREFRLALGRKCSTWETVSDEDVRKRCSHCREHA